MKIITQVSYVKKDELPINTEAILFIKIYKRNNIIANTLRLVVKYYILV